MTNARPISGYLEVNIDSMREMYDNAIRCCLENQAVKTPAEDVSVTALNDSMLQLFSIIETLDHQDDQASNVLEHEMSDLPDYGMGLLNKLFENAKLLDCDESSAIFERLSIPLAIWFARHDLMMHDVEIVVNAVTHTANQTQDPRLLSELADIIDVLVNVFSAEIKADLDKSNPGRPWRVLNLNQAIIATRTHDPKRMETVFEQLVFRLPEDAPGFFAEGMERMDIIDYPDHVREVMQTYFQMTNQPTLH